MQEEAATEAEVITFLEHVGQRLQEQLVKEGETDAIAPEELKGRILSFLKSEPGMMELLAAAFDSGKAEGLLEAAQAHGGPPSLQPGAAPDWGDMEGQGAMRATWRQRHLCGRCVSQRVCVVSRTLPAEWLVLIERCLEFIAIPE